MKIFTSVMNYDHNAAASKVNIVYLHLYLSVTTRSRTYVSKSRCLNEIIICTGYVFAFVFHRTFIIRKNMCLCVDVFLCVYTGFKHWLRIWTKWYNTWSVQCLRQCTQCRKEFGFWTFLGLCLLERCLSHTLTHTHAHPLNQPNTHSFAV